MAAYETHKNSWNEPSGKMGELVRIHSLKNVAHKKKKNCFIQEMNREMKLLIIVVFVMSYKYAVKETALRL